MKTIFLIRNRDASNWGSCRTIVPNLIKAYRDLPTYKIKVLKLDRHCDWDSMEALADKIFKSQPDQVSFVDHYPHPSQFLLHYAKKYGHIDRHPRFNIHLFGCAVYWLRHWPELKELFLKTQCRFIFASEAQRNLLGPTVNKIGTYTFPFPVDDTLFCHNKESRAQIRKVLKFSDDRVHITYAGRIAPQKNVDLLIQYLAPLLKANKIHLHLAGEFDDQGVPILGLAQSIGANYQHYQRLMKQFPESISWHSRLNHKKLAQLHLASDHFISLSTYNDEDYGYAPIEALMTGTPALITDWGGYKAYRHPNYCSLLKVKRADNELVFQNFIKNENLVKRLTSKTSESKRRSCHQYYKSRFGLSTAGKRLSRILDSCEGFESLNTDALNLWITAYSKFPPFNENLISYLDRYEAYYE